MMKSYLIFKGLEAWFNYKVFETRSEYVKIQIYDNMHNTTTIQLSKIKI